MMKILPKHLGLLSAVCLLSVFYTTYILYSSYDAEKQIFIHVELQNKSLKLQQGDAVIQTILPEDFSEYLVTTGISKNSCPLNITHESIVPLFTTANFEWSKFADFFATQLDIAAGGEWQPTSCAPRFFVALITACPTECPALRNFLMHMHPFLHLQNIHYRIYVVKQSPGQPFNKGKLLNVGFVEANKDTPYPCFIFHDIQLLPKNLNNIYACTTAPRDMAVLVDTLDRGLQKTFFSGVVSFLSSHFQLVNGFSTYEWADDDSYNRIRKAGQRPIRFEYNISAYYYLGPSQRATENPNWNLLYLAEEKVSEQGLSSTGYTIVSRSEESLFTEIIVEL